MWPVCLIMKFLFLLSVLVLGSATAQENFIWHGTLAAGKTIEIKGVNGNIQGERPMTGAVEVVAVKSARRSNTAEVRVDVVPHDGGVTLCAVYPGEGNRCGVGKDDVNVEFTVKVPAGVNLIAHTR